MSKYLNAHDLYKLPCRFNFHDNFRKKYIYDDRINNCNNSGELYMLGQEKLIEEIINNVMIFIDENFADLSNKEKKILCNNLLNAEQFTPAERY